MGLLIGFSGTVYHKLLQYCRPDRGNDDTDLDNLE